MRRTKADLVFVGLDGLAAQFRWGKLLCSRDFAADLADGNRTALWRSSAEPRRRPCWLWRSEDSRIHVTGTVPDVRPWLWGASASIVPLRIGGGTRLKIYEAMAAGTATVSTSIGAEGLDVSHPANIRLADTPEAFAEQCITLLQDATAAGVGGCGGVADLVTSRFSWDIVAAEFEKLLVVGDDQARLQ